MPTLVDKNICPHNHLCPLISLCPVEAIMQQQQPEFGYPQFDAEKCVECGACVYACPMNAVKIE